MFLSPLRLIAWLVGLLIVGLPLAAVGLLLLATVGSPGACETDEQRAEPRGADALAFQVKWNQFNGALDAGQPSSVVFTENESTARARVWVEENDAPVTNLLVCFTAEDAAASGTIDLPLFPGGVDVVVRGTLDLRGERPRAVIDEIEIGDVPGFVTDRIDRLVNDVIEDQLNKIELDHDYGVGFEPNRITVNGQP